MVFQGGVRGGNVRLEEGDGRRRMIGGCNQGGNFRSNMEKRETWLGGEFATVSSQKIAGYSQSTIIPSFTIFMSLQYPIRVYLNFNNSPF
jgi:hypothetical protein